MKKKVFVLLALFAFLTIKISGQCSKVEMKIEFLSNSCYSISVTQSGTNGKIIFKVLSNPTVNADPILVKFSSKKIKRIECEYLWRFLADAELKDRGSLVKEWIEKKYVSTIILPDSLRYVVNGDTIRKELLDWFGYTFDPDSIKCYESIIRQKHNLCSGGTVFQGEITLNNNPKPFRVSECYASPDGKKFVQYIACLTQKYGYGLGKKYKKELLDLLNI